MGGKPIQVREIAILTLFTLACLGVIFAGWLAFGGHLPLQAKGYRFQVAFPEARTLVSNADVRIAGVPVGRVISVKSGEDRTDAVLELKSRYAPLPSDAKAIIRNKTPLGESYIEITRGSPNAKPIPDGGRLSTRNVAPTQQIEEVLGAFDKKTRDAFRTFLLDATASLDGKSGDLNQALGLSGPAVDSGGEVVRALDRQSANVQTLVSRTGRALKALGERPEDLRGLVRSGQQVLSATAARDRELTATIRALAPFVGELRTTMRAVDRSLTLAAPTLKRLRPVTPLLTPALREADALAPIATKLLKDLRAPTRSLKKAAKPTTQLVDATRDSSDELNMATKQMLPPLQLLDAYRNDVVWNLGQGAAAFNYPKPVGGGVTSKYIRAAITFLSDAAPGPKKRPGYNRTNPYPAPGSQIGQTAYDCRNTSNPDQPPPLGTQIACKLQAPWEFQGQAKSFPQLSPYVPATK